MGRQSFRDKIVASGMQTVHRRGFATVGLREITAEAGVAQGSFTNHFASKEEFGVAIIDHYFDQVRRTMDETLGDGDKRAIERLRAYFEAITGQLKAAEWRYGCLVGNMGLEAAEHSEVIRLRLSEIFGELVLRFSEIVREGQAEGDIPKVHEPEELAAVLLEGWHGAMLRMKIERNRASLDRFMRLTFPALLEGASPR
jgi:TetR/AcrR family transcriptional repressor of nem operon